MSGRRILALGGAHVDRRGRLAAAAVAGASNPGSWRDEAGGGAFNAARCLAALGHRVRLISPRGGDAAGAMVSEAAQAAGIEDTPLTFLDRPTPSYTAIIEPDGNLVIALADMALYDLYGPRQIARRNTRDAIDAADAVLTDANLPEATIEALAEACGRAGKPLFAIAISPAKAVRSKPALGRLAGLFMNAAEAAVLGGSSPADMRDWPKLLRSAGLSTGAVSRGAQPAIAFDSHGAWHVAPPPVDAIGDVTGAGDALAAGFIDARLGGATAGEALRAGVAAANIVVQAQSAVPPEFGRAKLDDVLSLVPPAVLLA
jgi:sugar/nucleoside kinase (ribokinase family)